MRTIMGPGVLADRHWVWLASKSCLTECKTETLSLTLDGAQLPIPAASLEFLQASFNIFLALCQQGVDGTC